MHSQIVHLRILPGNHTLDTKDSNSDVISKKLPESCITLALQIHEINTYISRILKWKLTVSSVDEPLTNKMHSEQVQLTNCR